MDIDLDDESEVQLFKEKIMKVIDVLVGTTGGRKYKRRLKKRRL